MKERLKFIFLSFFHNGIARSAAKRPYWYSLGFCVFALTVLLFGIYGARVVPFRTVYHNAKDYRTTVQRALGDSGITLELRDGKMFSGRVGENVGAQLTLDTVKIEADKQLSQGGCTVVVDTRPSSTYDDFQAYCINSNGDEISYEEYRELDSDTTSKFKFKIRYTGETRLIDDAWIEKCETFLNGCDDAAIAKKYAKVKEKTDGEYATALYELYVEAYYPELAKIGVKGVPKVRNYYFRTRVEGGNYLFVFCDSIVGSFITSSDATYSFNGFYGDMSGGVVNTKNAENFIVDAFNGGKTLILKTTALEFVIALIYLVVAVTAFTFIFQFFRRLLRWEMLYSGESFRIICAFMPVSAVLSAVATLAVGFAVAPGMCVTIGTLLFGCLLFVRLAVLAGFDAINAKKQRAAMFYDTPVDPPLDADEQKTAETPLDADEQNPIDSTSDDGEYMFAERSEIDMK